MIPWGWCHHQCYHQHPCAPCSPCGTPCVPRARCTPGSTTSQVHVPVVPLEQSAHFQLPADVEDVQTAELSMMAHTLWRIQHSIQSWDGLPRVQGQFSTFLEVYPQLEAVEELARIGSEIKAVLGAYNRAVRLNITDKATWPRSELGRVAEKFPQRSLPPPTPCEYVEDEYAWSNWGTYDRADEWLGHGYFWRQRPLEHNEPVENMAGSSMNDFDLLEGGFCRLKQAKVLCADYALIRKDFGLSFSDGEIDEWLLSNAAYISEGQVARLQPGGDHQELLRVDNLDDFVDLKDRRGALRIRSGGRAATFFADNGTYTLDDEGFVHARMLDVKGVGVHKNSNYSDNVKCTGMLNFADALKELAIQRLVQRACDLEEGDTATFSTVPFYALLDTGLKYCGTNPATGWENEQCVLAVRQRQSRAFMHYEGYNFSGILLMSGEPPPAASVVTGNGRAMRRLLGKYGISSEFEPRALYHSIPNAAGDLELDEDRFLDDISGNWNLQADAPLTHFMDFSDYFVLPDSKLPSSWRMSEEALVNAYTLERPSIVEGAMAEPALRARLFGSPSEDVARQNYEERRALLSRQPKMREAAAAFDGDLIRASKPKFCQCWFMELDDSKVAQWSMQLPAAYARGEVSVEDLDILEQVEQWLPSM